MDDKGRQKEEKSWKTKRNKEVIKLDGKENTIWNWNTEN